MASRLEAPMSISRKQLAARLQLNVKTLTAWNKNGFLPYDADGLYSVDKINAFLAAVGRYFDPPLTWEQLASGEVVLLSPTEASKRFQVSSERLLHLAERHSVPYLLFPNERRYHVAALTWAVGTLTYAGATVDLAFAMRATGYEKIEWFKNELAPAILRVSRRLVVMEEPFHEYLRARLPPWISVEDWLDDVDYMEGPLKSGKATAIMLGVSTYGIVRELEQRRALFLTRYRSDGWVSVFVSPIWIHAQLEQDQPLAVTDLAQLFTVHPASVQRWIRSGLVYCLIAEHTHTEHDLPLWRSCWIAYLRSHCTPELQSRMLRFGIWRLTAENPAPLLTSAELMRHFGCSSPTLNNWVQQGKLNAIYTPGGELRCARAWVKEFERRHA